MPNNDRRDRTRATGELLKTLLRSREAYRARWRKAALKDSGDLNQSAIAQVIAMHLWERGERAESEVRLRRVLKDRVHRALAGDLISPETLSWFVDAFDMTPADSMRLSTVRFGGAASAEGPVVDTLRRPLFVPVPQHHRTLSVFERRTIGRDQRAVSHRTTRAILACRDGVASFPYRMLPHPEDIVVHHGGKVAAHREFAGSTPVLEIILAQSLAAGQVVSLDYEVRFGPTSKQATEYRRVANARTENVDITVTFHQEPRALWWTHWDDYTAGRIVHEEQASLDAEGSAHRFVPYLENSAAGFRWSW